MLNLNEIIIGALLISLFFPFLKRNSTLTLLVALVVLLAFFGDNLPKTVENFVVQGHGVPLEVRKSGPLEEDSMFLLKDNKCNLDCCSKNFTYTCDQGCVCPTNEQLIHLSNRGGNNPSSSSNY